MNLFGSICLSDIAATGMARRADNGKIYINIEVKEKKEVSRYGDTHFIAVTCKRDEKKEGVNYYVGNLKPSKFDNAQPVADDEWLNTPEEAAF